MPPVAKSAATAAPPSVPEQRPPPQVKSKVAFSIFFAANVIAAVFSPIQDCDEVFNYWEPTHYLNHGHGLQTWEYSPQYAIRSWAYTGMHAAVIELGRLLPILKTKTSQFYFLRIVLGFVCACCETKLFSVISKTLNPRVAIFFLMAMVSSPGMYHASIAYLPSSFAMYTTMVGFAAFMNWTGGMRTAQGIFWFAVGALLGWPFAGALVLPFIFEELFLAVTTGQVVPCIKRLLDGTFRSLLILLTQVVIDTYFYRKLVFVPLNIVLYNVFSGGSRGPDIYGVEPWHFYIRNLALNFNSWFFLAMAALPLLLLQHFASRSIFSHQALLRGVTFLSPFYLWLAIFTLQPHKEERFMYPAYPALAFNAATSLHIVLANFGSTDPKSLFSKIPAQVKLLFVSAFVLATFNIGAFRTIGTMTAYSAPLSVYRPLQQQSFAHQRGFICLGKEWYRFPSSYLLPEDTRPRFIKSEFSGLLPGEFSEHISGYATFDGAYMMPTGMNDENIEDPGKYTHVDNCNYLVDSRIPSMPATEKEPDFMSDTKTWEKVTCQSFLDASSTSVIGRLVWVPNWPFIPARFRRTWGTYCLLRRKD
ncbi:hypothetical protein DPSP01_000467 [Paraphaeosphaeria sporulosa]